MHHLHINHDKCGGCHAPMSMTCIICYRGALLSHGADALLKYLYVQSGSWQVLAAYSKKTCLSHSVHSAWKQHICCNSSARVLSR